MKKIVEYKLADGNSVCIEIDEVEPQGVAPVSLTSDAIENAQELFEDALAKIKPFARAIVTTLRDLSPDETTVEFGVKLSKKAGLVIAAAEAEANLQLKLTWKRPTTP
ncbi:MAG: hypothetical protein HOP19_22940 [Acidobacteria bacterium]|nr:hypothetical protein [Acidobacteriota bacterium]